MWFEDGAAQDLHNCLPVRIRDTVNAGEGNVKYSYILLCARPGLDHRRGRRVLPLQTLNRPENRHCEDKHTVAT